MSILDQDEKDDLLAELAGENTIKLTLVANGIEIEKDAINVGRIRIGDTINFRAFNAFIIEPVNTLIPKILFKLRFGVMEWVAMEILAEGTAEVIEFGADGDPDYVAAAPAIVPDRIAKYWLDMYAEPSLVNVDLADTGTISIIGYLESKGLLTAERGAEILAVEV
ncbi:MAG: hypothetical protein COB24_12010 [Hyphomicrobiales bacterium]|nr:MAG: hypothetical protein COB24_12010 [Hyphomicrobiales bacterium]